ncbi:PTS lactose/cellobiose transporter subunit IIA [Paenibacillus polymyxa]|uniref:PTS lactose/cellobiose transporter subunit IIA n=1 Tax=Paenibacillus TaxID=44249 RepID=UPI00024EF669|nr:MULTISPECIES: PTS lactose/cellobiose transporter subunit IIA [Paenibacillus]EHS55626.1 PTS system, cellobiose-specific IIA component [Paenibacillus sp. Aloe-11]MEC0236007.1 PTS lactose/cellobiose transporter subunit IIA [Paenibacillus kribbensis]
MDYEQAIMQLIASSGEARSLSLKAIRVARENNIQGAEEVLMQAKEQLTKAHKVQTGLIQAESRGEKNEVSLLLIHAQDHLMNALTVRELAIEMVEEIKMRIELADQLKGRVN